jgi:tRNA (guanine37-N1)-methyltransferase
MKFHVVTLFPELIEAYASHSIIGRAVRNKTLSIRAHQLRDFARNKWKKVDERPYAGGPGMVLQADPILRAVDKIKKGKRTAIVVTAAGGKQFTNAEARAFAKKYDQLIFVAGHYEGIDARVTKALKAKEYSVGPYILTGGEVPALIMIDAIARQIPGTLGKFESLEEDRVSSHDVYTRPEVLTYKGKKYRVPKVLLSGHHGKIEEWKKKRGL